MIGKFIAADPNVDSIPFHWCVLSRKNSGVNYATAGTAAVAVRSVQIKDVIATMHSRKLGVGS
jgi:hypothetical protein